LVDFPLSVNYHVKGKQFSLVLPPGGGLGGVKHPPNPPATLKLRGTGSSKGEKQASYYLKIDMQKYQF